MFNTRIPAIFLAALFTLGALVVSAPEAHASAASLGKAFQTRHAQAARSTQAANREWARFGRLSNQFDNAMRSSNAASRAQAKRTAQLWLKGMKRLLDKAARDHASAIRALDSYLRFVGANPQAQTLRRQLAAAERGIRKHSREITNISRRVSRS